MRVAYSLSEPMASHAVSGPLSLANPAPFQATLWALHVHAPSVPFCWCPTLGTGLGWHSDGHIRAKGLRTGPPDPRSWSGRWPLWGLLTLAQMKTLTCHQVDRIENKKKTSRITSIILDGVLWPSNWRPLRVPLHLKQFVYPDCNYPLEREIQMQIAWTGSSFNFSSQFMPSYVQSSVLF